MKREVNKIIKEYIEREEREIKEHNEIKGILVEFEGKPINRVTFNEKRLKGYKLKVKHGMFHIKGEFNHLIGFDSSPFVNSEKFEDWDACNGSAAQERIERIKSADMEKVLKIFGQIKRNYDALCKAFGDVEREDLGSFYFPVYYEILRAIQGEPDNYSKKGVKLSDMYFNRK